MSTGNLSSLQRNKHEAPLSNVDIENGQSATEGQPASSRIRVRDVLILGGLGALGPLANDMYVPALPALSHDLSATTSQAQMTLSAFILGLALGGVDRKSV